MPNIPHTPPCNTWSAIHEGCSIDRSTFYPDMPPAGGGVLVVVGGTVNAYDAGKFTQDTPPGFVPTPIETPNGPAKFPPPPPFGP